MQSERQHLETPVLQHLTDVCQDNRQWITNSRTETQTQSIGKGKADIFSVSGDVAEVRLTNGRPWGGLEKQHVTPSRVADYVDWPEPSLHHTFLIMLYSIYQTHFAVSVVFMELFIMQTCKNSWKYLNNIICYVQKPNDLHVVWLFLVYCKDTMRFWRSNCHKALIYVCFQ